MDGDQYAGYELVRRPRVMSQEDFMRIKRKVSEDEINRMIEELKRGHKDICGGCGDHFTKTYFHICGECLTKLDRRNRGLAA